MNAFICECCGAQYPATETPPRECILCLDPRHLVRPIGQIWTTPDALRQRHYNAFRQHEPDLIGVGSVPQFSIGQRAILVRTPKGNILWDCISLIDPVTVEIIKGLGGISAIAISHPHYYASMVDWSDAFGGVPIYLHGADRKWVTRPSKAIEFWDGETKELADGLTLIRVGGHFAGGTVCHWARGSAGKGSLLAGDLIMLVPDQKFVGFMRSYPNYIPISAAAATKIGQAVEPFGFEAIYSPFFDRTMKAGGKEAVRRSVRRYVEAVNGEGPE